MTVHPRNWTQIVGATTFIITIGLVAGLSRVAAQDAQAGAAATVSAGVYTDEQAKRGETVAGKLCTSCHGPDLSGGEAGPSLVGLEFLGNWNSLSMGDLYDRVHSTMPADAPGTMTPQQVSDVAAYVLKLNKFPAGKSELPTDVAALKTIKIEGQPPAK